MENFIYDIPTKVYFGKGMIEHLKEEIPKWGTRVLLVYGGGSIKQNGIYDEISSLLKGQNLFYVECSGVEANPRIETVRKGVKLCEENEIDVVLAIGGGSVIDCAKAIAASYASNVDAWELVDDFSKVKEVLPIIAVATVSATGSEMDGIGVISNMKTREKRPLKHPLLRPKAAILDPTYTCTVSKKQTAAGIVDILSHLMETYFAKEEGEMQQSICEALMRTCIHQGLEAYHNGDNYEARANLMWTATWAINDFLKCGRSITWSVHAIEHQLSAYYDITHGVGLAILTPIWMEYIMNETTIPYLARYAREVWKVDERDNKKAALKGIDCLKKFFEELGLPSNLREAGIEETVYFGEMVEKAMPYLKNIFYPLNKEDVMNIYKKCF